ncbi:unnamed protein product [Spirodela intermedia]|uniref:Retrotransposon gag domain-containing protein n=1 Tax=Spirodela intermedia TaxID=51605 RepID=A0A7I8JYR4_SPIIN|nr:unnamed protein product [Spirodela intermedia]
MRLKDYSIPLQYRPVTKVNAPIGEGVNFRVDHHIVQMLPNFHGMSHEEPYKHLEDFSQVYEISYYPKVPLEVIKMRLFPFTLKDKAKKWFRALAQDLNSWGEMETTFLKKLYYVGRTNAVKKAIRDFNQGPWESFYKAWERMKEYTKQCPHHGIQNWQLVQIFMKD